MLRIKLVFPRNKHVVECCISSLDSVWLQLIEKDPSRAISLFWSAINAGDRVDSALKDMAIVMKQLDRSDEAIEAIKSFRHLCSNDSQESLDNVLVELYKVQVSLTLLLLLLLLSEALFLVSAITSITSYFWEGSEF